jgi:hypothetical protein
MEAAKSEKLRVLKEMVDFALSEKEREAEEVKP